MVSMSSGVKSSADASGEAAGGANPYWYSHPQGRVIVEGPGVTPDLWQAELKSLESDLLVEGGAKPLTIEAASALTSARQGAFTSVGAAIDSVEFEPVLTYLHRHGSQPSTTTFFGTSYEEFGELDNRSIVLRIRLTEPDWLTHEVFLCRPRCRPHAGGRDCTRIKALATLPPQEVRQPEIPRQSRSDLCSSKSSPNSTHIRCARKRNSAGGFAAIF